MTAIGPGSIVVCVDASGIESQAAALSEGARYVVREVAEGIYDNGETVPTILLRGVANKGVWRGLPGEWGYELSRFRPIDDRDTAIFTDILADTKKKVSA